MLMPLDLRRAPPESAMWRAVRAISITVALLAGAIALLFLLSGVALAQEVAAPAGELDPMALLSAIIGAVQAGQWPVAAVLLLVVAIWALRTFGAKAVPWLGTSEGGTVLAFLTALAGTLGAAALAGGPVTWALVGSALAGGFTAIGAWTGARRLLRALVPLAARVHPALGAALSWLSGAGVKEQIAAETDKAYQPLQPAPTAQAAADLLGKPPVP